MEPLRFRPLLRRTLWGGRRLGTDLAKPIGQTNDYGESWEVADLPGWESVIASGSLAGNSIRILMNEHQEALLGRQAGWKRFPLLVKYIDAQKVLSVQVHPAADRAATPAGSTSGKAELWVVLDALPGSRMYLGLKPGVDDAALRAALTAGTIESCLHTYEPQPGDVFFLQPGLLHALGAGLLIAEVQQTNDVTYRLFDWNRVDSSGRPRELHQERALEAIDFSLGPVSPVPPIVRHAPGSPEQLIESPYFNVDRYSTSGVFTFPHDQRMHVLTVLAGDVEIAVASAAAQRIQRGETIILPAEREPVTLNVGVNAVLVDAFLPWR